ncbi:MAG: hypothetical protein GXP26_05055 [Planctomycetes bacterium]|nr:hypothetical protein [Planctomycetota bacterium]
MQITHCDHCGLKTAVLAIQGEVSSQFVCQSCNHDFERDNVPNEALAFRTKARPQAIHLRAIGGLPAIMPTGANQR